MNDMGEHDNFWGTLKNIYLSNYNHGNADYFQELNFDSANISGPRNRDDTENEKKLLSVAKLRSYDPDYRAITNGLKHDCTRIGKDHFKVHLKDSTREPPLVDIKLQREERIRPPEVEYQLIVVITGKNEKSDEEFSIEQRLSRGDDLDAYDCYTLLLDQIHIAMTRFFEGPPTPPQELLETDPFFTEE